MSETAPAEAPPPVAQSSSATFKPGEAPTAGSASAPASHDELVAAVKKQVEYYFSDSNFGRDKFLKEETAKTAEQWIHLSVIATFNRMKALVPDLSLAVYAEALKGSTTVELSEDGTAIRRHTDRWLRTLGGTTFRSRAEVVAHARGLIEKGSATQGEPLPADALAFVTDLLQFHERAKEKEGAGLTAVTVGCNPAFPDTKCFVLVRSDGSTEDFSYIKCAAAAYPSEPQVAGGKGGGGGGGGGGRGGGGGGRGEKRKAPDGERDEADAKKAAPEFVYTKGTIVCVQQLADGATQDSLREKFEPAAAAAKGKVKFIELVADQPLAYVRFDEAATATAALAVEGVGTLSVLSGADEEQYWDKIKAAGNTGGRGGTGGDG